MGDTVDTTVIPTDTGNGMLKLNPLPLLPLLLMLMPAPNLTTTDTTDIPTDTVDIMAWDTVDTMDTLTDTGSEKQLPLKNMPSKNDLLMPKLMPAPNLTTTDTTDIPTDTVDTTDTDITDIVTDTVTDTGVKFLPP